MTRKTSFAFFSLLLAAGLLLGACSPQASGTAGSSEEGVITISGAFALYPMMTVWAEQYQSLHPGVEFDISAGGAGKGMTDALSGAVDIGMVSREIKAEETAQGAYGVAVTKDAVFPVVNAANPVLAMLLEGGLSQETFAEIYLTGTITTWGQAVGDPANTDPIHVYTRSDACGAAEMWAKYLGGLQEDLLGIGVNADPGLLEAVISDPLGIGYNNLGYAFDNQSGLPVTGAVVVPLDIDGSGAAEADELYQTKDQAVTAIADGLYPSPPARELYLVTNGRPSGLVQAFIRWILTDGQQYVDQAGYVQLTGEQLLAELRKVE